MRKTVLFCALILFVTTFPEATPAAPLSGTDHDSGTINFALVADQHYGWRSIPVPLHESATVRDWMEHPDLPSLDFVVASLGDWVSDNRLQEEWLDVDEVWRQIARHSANLQEIPWYFITGNHDLSNYDRMPASGNPMLNERLGRTVAGMNENCFAFLHNGVLFIGLGQTNVLYHLSHTQRDWLEYLTATYHHNSTVILTHQAIHETTGQGNFRATSWTADDYKIYNDITWWQNFFSANPQVRLFMHGHNEKAWNTVAFNLHAGMWDDNCTFVLVPGTGKDYGQDAWSYIVTIGSHELGIRLWDSEAHAFIDSEEAGVPYQRPGDFQVAASGMEWFSIPRQVLDGQQWQWTNQMLAEEYRLELIGSATTELIDNPELDGCHESDEVSGIHNGGYWYAVRGDETALNRLTGEEDGLIRIAGGNTLELAASGARQVYVEGKVPHNTGAAIPGKSYTFSADLRTEAGEGLLDILVSIPCRETLDKYVWEDRVVAGGLLVSPEMQTFSATFTVPDDPRAWFIQPKLRLHDREVIYVWDRWSLRMDGESSMTEDFTVTLNGNQCSAPGPLEHLEPALFQCQPHWFGNRLDFSCAIGGNRTGLLRLVYLRPSLWSDDASIGILNQEQSLIRLEDRSPYNDRTTVMGFDADHLPLIRPGFSNTVVRGKPLCTHPSAGPELDGEFTIQPAPQVSLSAVTPQVPPGGLFVFDLTVSNPSQTALVLEVWTENPVPGIQDLSPLKGPFPLVLGPGESRTWEQLEQPVGGIPPGTYRYQAWAGEAWPGPRWSEGWCEFEVLP